MATVTTGLLVMGLILYLLGLIEINPAPSSASAEGVNQASEALLEQDPAEVEAAIQEEMIKGGFTTKEAYFSSELTKQASDVSAELTEFGKKMKSIRPKFDVTGLVIEGKLGQLTKTQSLDGFGIEVVTKKEGESDEVSLISHLKGMTSSVKFYAEGGRIVAHFKDYPESYCTATKGAAVCGS